MAAPPTFSDDSTTGMYVCASCGTANIGWYRETPDGRVCGGGCPG